MSSELDAAALGSLEDALRKAMSSTSGPKLDAALAELGWASLLSEVPQQSVPLVFRLLGETGSHASVLNDVVQQTADRELGATPALPYAGGSWVVWDYRSGSDRTLGGLPLHRVEEGGLLRLADARRALGWWLVGSSRAMLELACQHALDHVRFGEPMASSQAVRHRLAATLVAIEGAEATLQLPGVDNPDLTALLAKAAAGGAALMAAKHCQQVLGSTVFAAERALHHHVERVLVLDGLLGSSRELTRKAGAGLRARGSVPRLAQL